MNHVITTTLNAIREHHPCEEGWRRLLDHLGKPGPDDEPFPLSVLLDSGGLEDCIWCLRVRPDLNSLWRLYAVWCARRVQHFMTDPRSIAALDVAERHALGQATDEELATAWADSRAAQVEVRQAASWASTDVASWTAAEAASRTAEAVVAGDAVGDAAGAAEEAAVQAVTSDATWTAARTARTAQIAKLRQILDAGEWVA